MEKSRKSHGISLRHSCGNPVTCYCMGGDAPDVFIRLLIFLTILPVHLCWVHATISFTILVYYAAISGHLLLTYSDTLFLYATIRSTRV